MAHSARRIGVTGTDTGIGKTVVTAALACRARQLGLRAAAMKPVESGVVAMPTADGDPDSDVSRLHRATGRADDVALMRPYALAEPLAPWVAAERAGIEIDVARLDEAAQRLAAARDLLLVETAGGVLVPLTRDLAFLDLFRRWHADIVLVAGNRLGVINHTLLTVRAVEEAGLAIGAIVLADFARGDATIAQSTNFDALCALLPGRPISRFPFLRSPDDPATLAAAAAEAGLDDLLLGRR